MNIQPQLAWSQDQARISVRVNASGVTASPYYPGNFKPDPAVVNLIKGLKLGDEVIIGLSVNANKLVATSIRLVNTDRGDVATKKDKEEIKTVPPEEEPNVYIFKSFGAGKLAVTKKDHEGKLQELTILVAKKFASKLGTCKEGDLLFLAMESDTGRNYLTFVDPYKPASRGTFLKAERSDGGKGKDLSVQIQTDMGVSTFVCPGGSKLMQNFNSVRTGQLVLYRVNKDDNKTLYSFEQAVKK